MYVGIHADIEIHKAAKLASPHFLRSHETGARSLLYSGPARAACSAEASNAGVASTDLGFRVPNFEFLVPGRGRYISMSVAIPPTSADFPPVSYVSLEYVSMNGRIHPRSLLEMNKLCNVRKA
jgi:hypothetical protein